MASLLTIVFTDVVGSSATKRETSLGRDSRERDQAYLQTIQAAHFSLVRACTQAHGGREVSTMGDAFYLTFEDPIAAVRCAAEIQKRLAAEPIETPRGPLRLRIGIHSGYPRLFEGSYHGTDVDKAARVEAMATAQQILLSSTTYELVHEMTDVKFHRLGQFALKGVERVVLWEADWDGKGPRRSATPPLETRTRRKKNLALAGLAAALMLVVAVGYRYFARRAMETAGGGGNLKLRPSVAVLGFKNLGKPDSGWLSTALSEMFTTELAAGEQMRAIPGENVAHAKIDLSLPDADSYSSDTLARLRQNLGADDVVVGSYLDLGQAAGGQLRLDVCAQDTRAGSMICAVSETGTEGKLFDLVSKTGSELRKHLGIGEVTAPQAALVQTSLPSDAEAARLYSEGLAKLRAFDNLGAREALQRAIAAQGNFGPAHAALAAAWQGLGYDQKAAQEAKRALDLSGNLSREDRRSVEGRYDTATRQWDKAIATYQALFNFFPDNLEYGLQLARVQNLSGRSKESLKTVEALRKLPPPERDDPRVDLGEEAAAAALGDYQRAQAAASRAAEKAGAAGARMLLAYARIEQGWDLFRLGRNQEALTALDEGQRANAAAGHRQGVAAALINKGAVLGEQDNLTGARQSFAQGLEIAREVGAADTTLHALIDLAKVSVAEGKPAEGEASYQQALNTARQIDDKEAVETILVNLAQSVYEQGDLPRALDFDQQSLSLAQELGGKLTEATAAGSLGQVLLSQGRPAEAERRYKEALTLFRSIGNPGYQAQALLGLAQAYRAQGDLGAAREGYQEAVAIFQKLGDRGSGALAQAYLASLDLEGGKAPLAEAPLRQALQELQKEQDTGSAASVAAMLANGLLAQGKTREAEEQAVWGQSHVAELSDPGVRLDARIGIAHVRAVSGSPLDAAQGGRDLQAAFAEATRIGFIPQQLAARLAEGQIKMRSGQPAAGRSLLEALEKDARARGFGLIARQAHAMLKN